MRAESVGALLNCLTIWALTVYLLIEAVSRLIHPITFFQPRMMLFTSAFGVFANMMMAVVIHGWSILGYMIKYPCLSEHEKTTITFVDDGENLNIRAVMAHIMGKIL
jgi:Co/Zn/Cd efflux system component